MTRHLRRRKLVTAARISGITGAVAAAAVLIPDSQEYAPDSLSAAVPSAAGQNVVRPLQGSEPEREDGRRTGVRSVAEGVAASGESPSLAPAPSNPATARTDWTEADLQRRAMEVEVAANHELGRLVRLLDLDPAQQDRIFSILARNNPSWHPGMQTLTTGIAGTVGPEAPPAGQEAPLPEGARSAPGPAPIGIGLPDSSTNPIDDIYAGLTPDQQIILATEELERVEWWQEVIDRILPEHEIPSVPVPGVPATVTRPPAIKEFHGDDVIVD